ncbi:MAG: hypothetical protein Q8O74_06625 [bacterium]|nr:hypothetical protein [bacterium]
MEDFGVIHVLGTADEGAAELVYNFGDEFRLGEWHIIPVKVLMSDLKADHANKHQGIDRIYMIFTFPKHLKLKPFIFYNKRQDKLAEPGLKLWLLPQCILVLKKIAGVTPIASGRLLDPAF